MIELGPTGLVIAFAAGVVSFTSPCVLPLVPGYLSFISGVGFDELGSRPRTVTRSTAAFVAGFTAMFVALGAGAAWFGNVLLANRRPLEIAAGVFVILAALTFVGTPLPGFLSRELRLRTGGVGLPAATLLGVAFAVGWTPCVGPTLAAILTLSAGGGSPSEGAVLLAAFPLGLGLPFLVPPSAARRRRSSFCWELSVATIGGVSPATLTPAEVELEEPVQEDVPEHERPWIVIVWNDPINLMSYVTFVFQKLFGYSREKATKLMLQVHNEGKAVVSGGPREKAELDVARLHAHGLWATMRQD